MRKLFIILICILIPVVIHSDPVVDDDEMEQLRSMLLDNQEIYDNLEISIGGEVYYRRMPEEVEVLQRLVTGLSDIVNYLNDNYILADEELIVDLTRVHEENKAILLSISDLKDLTVEYEREFDELQEIINARRWVGFGIGPYAGLQLSANSVKIDLGGNFLIPISDNFMLQTQLGINVPSFPLEYRLSNSIIYKLF